MKFARSARSRTGSLLVGSIAALALAFSPAAAQQVMSSTLDEPSQAARLHAQAMALSEQPSGWRTAARLFHEAALARLPADAQRVADLSLSGALYYAVKDARHAGAMFEQAAAAALEFGQVAKAARFYLNAAIVAKARGQLADATEFGRKAERLAQSPHLTVAECNGISGRIIWVKSVTRYASR